MLTVDNVVFPLTVTLSPGYFAGMGFIVIVSAANTFIVTVDRRTAITIKKHSIFFTSHHPFFYLDAPE
jgi:hypothetical protein